MDGTGCANDSVRAKQTNSKVVDVSSIPKAVKWMVGMGKEKGKQGGNMEVSSEELEINKGK